MRKSTRLAIASGLALTSIVGIRTLSAFSEDKAGAAPITDGTEVIDAPSGTVASPSPYTVPASKTPPTGTLCPPSWAYFDNPAMHYGLCYPAGWGFTEYNASLPLASVRSQTLLSLHLASPDAFPFPAGSTNFGGIARGMTDVELAMYDPTGSIEDSCTFTQVQAQGRTFNACTQFLDANGYPTDSTGTIRTLSVLLPLKQIIDPNDTTPAPDGAQLLVVARAQRDTFSTEEDLLWKLIATITAY